MEVKRIQADVSSENHVVWRVFVDRFVAFSPCYAIIDFSGLVLGVLSSLECILYWLSTGYFNLDTQ